MKPFLIVFCAVAGLLSTNDASAVSNQLQPAPRYRVKILPKHIYDGPPTSSHPAGAAEKMHSVVKLNENGESIASQYTGHPNYYLYDANQHPVQGVGLYSAGYPCYVRGFNIHRIAIARCGDSTIGSYTISYVIKKFDPTYSGPMPVLPQEQGIKDLSGLNSSNSLVGRIQNALGELRVFMTYTDGQFFSFPGIHILLNESNKVAKVTNYVQTSLWDQGSGSVYLPEISPGVKFLPRAFSNSDVVVGVNFPNQNENWVWQGGTYRKIEGLPGDLDHPEINDQGTIVGNLWVGSVQIPVLVLADGRWFYLNDLLKNPMPGCVVQAVYDINNAGLIGGRVQCTDPERSGAAVLVRE